MPKYILNYVYFVRTKLSTQIVLVLL